MTRRIRSTVEPIIFTTGRAHRDEGVNTILDVARDLYDGSLYDWAYDLLFTTQILRMAYDSPRIGGGIDPNLAYNLPSWDDAVAEGGMFAYIVGDPQGDPTNTLDGIDADRIQDMIVHAEAVAVLAIHMSAAYTD